MGAPMAVQAQSAENAAVTGDTGFPALRWEIAALSKRTKVLGFDRSVQRCWR